MYIYTYIYIYVYTYIYIHIHICKHNPPEYFDIYGRTARGGLLSCAATIARPEFTARTCIALVVGTPARRVGGKGTMV